MSQVSVPTPRRQEHPAKIVYFATGSPAEVAADFSRLRLTGNGTRLRVVALPDAAQQLAKTPGRDVHEIILYRPYLAPAIWIRLLAFLGLSRRVEILCLTSPQRFRFLKFLALTLRGRVIFSPVSGARVPLGFFDLASIWLRHRWNAHEERRKDFPVGVIGSASGYYLERILPAVRARYPGAPVHGLLPPAATAQTMRLFDSVQVFRPGLAGFIHEAWRLARVRSRYQRWIIPCTNEPYRFLKLMSCLWPLTRRQIYNELSDGFAVRNVNTLWRHIRWRLREHLSFQVVSGAAGARAPLRALHLALYGVRLLAAIPLLLLALLRSLRTHSRLERAAQYNRRRTGESPSDDKKDRVGIKLARTIAPSSRPPAEPGGSVSV